MDESSVKLIAMAITIGVGFISPGLAIGLIASKALEAIGRNPETENSIRSNMILGIVFAETLAIFALVVAFIIRFVA